MITVKIVDNNKYDFYEVEVSGHAYYGEYGSDIVCSAVSMLTITTLNGLVDIVKADVDYVIEDGYTKFVVKNKKSDNSIKLLIDTYELGIKAVLEDYGQYVKLEKKEVQLYD